MFDSRKAVCIVFSGVSLSHIVPSKNRIYFTFALFQYPPRSSHIFVPSGVFLPSLDGFRARSIQGTLLLSMSPISALYSFRFHIGRPLLVLILYPVKESEYIFIFSMSTQICFAMRSIESPCFSILSACSSFFVLRLA